MAQELRASVVIDYQNVHLTARDVFAPHAPTHRSLIHPVFFAKRAVHERNSRQRPGYPQAAPIRVLVYRGLPHVDYDPAQHARNLAQRERWLKDGATAVELRDLKYEHQRGADGKPILDIHGKKIAVGPGREKGIDVLVALACVREAQREDVDLVVLASRDTDLVPVLDEVCDMPRGRIETVTWYEKGGRNFGSLRPTAPRKIWNTNMGSACYQASLDPNQYL